MAVDYDLVIVGSSWAGIYAAKKAVTLQARVALVTQSQEKYLPNDLLFNLSWGEIGNFNDRQKNSFLTATKSTDRLASNEVDNWINSISLGVQDLNSLASLAALGVDVIVGKGEFFARSQLGLQVGQRSITSRSFLLATGTNYGAKLSKPEVYKDCLTLRDLKDKNLADLSENIIVVGGDPTALALAQTLARLKKKVTLVVQQPRILPQEDLDIAMHIQGHLEAEGITIFTDSTISQVETIDRQKCLQAGNRSIWADEIIVVGDREANIADLNLPGVGVKCNQKRVFVNKKLQTTNPKIYACGDLIGGYYLPNIARYEVNLILKNSLFLARYVANYSTVPWGIFTQPNLARVGLNEQQIQHYPDEIFVIKQYFSTVEQAQINNKITGFCKLLVKPNGELLGCSIIGDRAVELIGIPALMMQHQLKLDSNPMRGLTSLSTPTIFPSMAEILTQASDNFYQHKIRQNPQLLNRLIAWFSQRKN